MTTYASKGPTEGQSGAFSQAMLRVRAYREDQKKRKAVMIAAEARAARINRELKYRTDE